MELSAFPWVVAAIPFLKVVSAKIIEFVENESATLATPAHPINLIIFMTLSRLLFVELQLCVIEVSFRVMS
jgi:hypothetical protein